MPSSPRLITHVNAKSLLRSDFYSKHDRLIKHVLDISGAKIFCHTMTYERDDITRFSSEFLNHEAWQEIYWSKYYDKNPTTEPLTTAARKFGFVFTMCDVIDPNSDCMEARRSICGTQNSFAFVIAHGDHIIENIAFAYDHSDLDKTKFSFLESIFPLLGDLRQEHLESINEYLIEQGDEHEDVFITKKNYPHNFPM